MTDLRASQAAVIAATGGVANANVSQLAIYSLGYEPTRALRIDVSQAAVIVPSIDNTLSQDVQLSQMAIYALSQEIPFRVTPMVIKLPPYLFSCISFLIEK